MVGCAQWEAVVDSAAVTSLRQHRHTLNAWQQLETLTFQCSNPFIVYATDINA